jgi:hypothetical protein
MSSDPNGTTPSIVRTRAPQSRGRSARCAAARCSDAQSKMHSSQRSDVAALDSPSSDGRSSVRKAPVYRRPMDRGNCSLPQDRDVPVNQTSRGLVDSGLASALDEKSNNFLPSSIGLDILIFRKTASAARASHVRRARTVSASKQKATRKWRRKPLKLLKMDSEMRAARLNVS